MFDVVPLGLDGVFELRPKKHHDPRGFFSETWNAESLADAGIDIQFVQDNHSYSACRAQLRGLHYQLPPKAQDKLVRVIRGAIFDVAVDIRHGSPTFGRWVGVEVSAERWNQLLVPQGFAHGFVTLAPDTEVLYKTSSTFAASLDRAIRFDDPEIGIVWPIKPDVELLSQKDKSAPSLHQADLFDYARAA